MCGCGNKRAVCLFWNYLGEAYWSLHTIPQNLKDLKGRKKSQSGSLWRAKGTITGLLNWNKKWVDRQITMGNRWWWYSTWGLVKHHTIKTYLRHYRTSRVWPKKSNSAVFMHYSARGGGHYLFELSCSRKVLWRELWNWRWYGKRTVGAVYSQHIPSRSRPLCWVSLVYSHSPWHRRVTNWIFLIVYMFLIDSTDIRWRTLNNFLVSEIFLLRNIFW